MAITENKYTGDGTTVLYSFTFPYLEVADIKISLDGTLTTAYTLANATTVRFNTAPANGVAIRLFRQTDDEALTATFFPGSSIRAQDLNDNFTQNLYVTQEASRDAGGAVGNANLALSTANTALSTANTALSNSSTAISTANNANTKADTAISTSNDADAKASAALSAVAGSIQYKLVADVAAIPTSPANGDAIEVADSTGIEGFTPLVNLPAGYVGDAGLSVRLQYSAVDAAWNWLNYSANNSETRYLKLTGGTLGGNLTLNTQSDLRFADADSSNWVAFQGPATVNNNVTWTLPATDGSTGQVLSTDGTGTLSWTDGGSGGGGPAVVTSDTPPSNPTDGLLWYDSVGGRTYVYYEDPNSSQWVDIAPQGGGGGGGGGKILQVVRSHVVGKASTTSTSLTKLATSSSITPTSSSNKIKVTISTAIGNADSGNANFSIVRTVGGTDTTIFNNMANKQGPTDGFQSDFLAWTDLDSPATTSAVTYSISALRVDGNATPFVGGRNTDNSYPMGVMFILEEVAA